MIGPTLLKIRPNCYAFEDKAELHCASVRNSDVNFISRNSNVNWPPRTCDLTPCDFFLWGFAKSPVYANKPETIPELQDVIGEIQPYLHEKVIENCTKRVMACHQSREGH